jgi:hypothetical protein
MCEIVEWSIRVRPSSVGMSGTAATKTQAFKRLPHGLGMNLPRLSGAARQSHLPHERGDEPYDFAILRNSYQSASRAWG